MSIKRTARRFPVVAISGEAFFIVALSAILFLMLLSLVYTDNTLINRIELLDIETRDMQERIQYLEKTRRP